MTFKITFERTFNRTFKNSQKDFQKDFQRDSQKDWQKDFQRDSQQTHERFLRKRCVNTFSSQKCVKRTTYYRKQHLIVKNSSENALFSRRRSPRSRRSKRTHERFLRKSVSTCFLRKSVSNEQHIVQIYNNLRMRETTTLNFQGLQRERSFFATTQPAEEEQKRQRHA